ncbi:MAG: FKBP-type peptidyl-prolyl cis-trans isomerase [Prolixibacteraceae bacterium]|jgi:FKBP-type peptidyl-prolyl cis-trans isomerase|nr:FKBP-type peptidyl-prolyl cis-trans isomerase [Prolixibacteraceae bacterium]
MLKNNLVLIIAAMLLIGFASCNNTSSSSKAIVETEADSVALSIGYSIGSNLNQQFPDVSPELIAQGIVEGYNEQKNPLFETPKAADAAIRKYMNSASERQADANKKEGEAFLEKNAKRKGIQVTESGLQYEVIEEGDGEKPAAENTVKVHYHGTTIDGEVFDSSVDSGEPVTFPLNGVITGWTEGLQLMPVGAKYKFYIPSDLAYGQSGASGMIGPNSTLIFEVELLEIVK